MGAVYEGYFDLFCSTAPDIRATLRILAYRLPLESISSGFETCWCLCYAALGIQCRGLGLCMISPILYLLRLLGLLKPSSHV